MWFARFFEIKPLKTMADRIDELIKSYKDDIKDLENDIKKNKDGNAVTDRLLRAWKARLRELMQLKKRKET